MAHARAIRLTGRILFGESFSKGTGFPTTEEEGPHAESEEYEDPREPEGRIRRREPGEPALSLLRQAGRRGGPSGPRRTLPGHGGRRDRARPRPPRVPPGSRRSGHRRADRRYREEPQGRRSGRDVRVHADVPGLRQAGARGRLRGDRRVVRDAGEGGEGARRPVREGPAAGQGGRMTVSPRKRRHALKGGDTRDEVADRRTAGLVRRHARDGVRQPSVLGPPAPGI